MLLKIGSMDLTKAEEQVMKILWKIEKGLIRNIVSAYDEPKPAYTTVATITKILEKKGFVNKNPIGNTFEYHPTLSKQEYTNGFLQRFVGKYFSNSYKSMISSFSSSENLSAKEMEEIIEVFQKQLKSKNEN
jgi:BlaI family penicillinase repressor